MALQARANRGEDVSVKPPTEALTLRKWCETWLDIREKQGLSSAADDESRLRLYVYPSLGETALDAIRTVDVRLALASLPSTLSAFSQRNVAAVLRKTLADAVRATHIRVSPFPGDWKTPRRVVKQLQFLFPTDLLKLANCAQIPVSRRRLWCVMTYTGVRVGELIALQVQDVELRRGTLTISKAYDRKTEKTKSTKSGKPRTFRVEPAILPLLRTLTIDRSPTAPLIRLPAFHDHLPKLLRADLALAQVQMRQPDGFTQAIRVHDLRATYISWRLARGDAPMLVRDAAGHSEFSTTEIYWRNVIAEAEGEAFFPELPDEISGGIPAVERTSNHRESPYKGGESQANQASKSDVLVRFPKPKVTSSILVGGAVFLALTLASPNRSRPRGY